MIIQEEINLHFTNNISVMTNLQESQAQAIEDSIIMIGSALKNGNKLLIAGNGGSAADAQHIAAELIIRLNKNITRPALPAIALSTDSSILTAAGNDIGFEKVFARQVEGLGQPGDILWAISTSGNSENLILATKKAREKGMRIFGLLGSDGGKLKPFCDKTVIIPSDNTQHIQEGHIAIYHIICWCVEKYLFKQDE